MKYMDVYDLEDGSLGMIPMGAVEKMPQPKVGVALRPDRVRVSTSLVRDKRTGKIYVDAFKRHAKPYWLSTEPKEQTILAADGNPQTFPIVMPTDRQGPVEIDYSFFQSTGDFSVTIIDPDGRPLLMNREIHVRTMCSGGGTPGLSPASAGRPFIWPEPWFLQPKEGRRNFMVSFRNLSGADNTIRFVFHGRRFYHQASPTGVVKRYERYFGERPITSPYFYTTNQEAKIPAGSAVGTEFEFNIRIFDDSDAVFYKMTSVQDQPYEFKLIEQSTGRELMTDWVRVENGFGNAELPFIMFEPIWWESGTKLTLKIRSLVLDNDNDQIIWPTFVATRILRGKEK